MPKFKNTIKYVDSNDVEYPIVNWNIKNGEGTGSAHILVQPGRETFEGLYGATGNDASENYPNPYIVVQNNKFTLDNVEYTVNFSNGQPTTVTSSVASYPVTTVSGEKFATINGIKVEILYNLLSQATSIIRYATWTAGALGKYTFQWGGTSSAKNDRSAVGGTKNVVGYGAFAGGDTNYAANFGFATGYKNYAGLYGFTAGTRNFGMASAIFLRGNENRAYAPYADMSGWDNVVTENGSHGRVSGAHNKVNAPYGDATGSYNTVNGSFGRSYGGNNESNGDFATAGGQNTKADGSNSKTDGSRTHTIKEILKATSSSQKTLGLTVGKRYRFYGTLPSFGGFWYRITCSSIENIDTSLTPRATTETGYGFGSPGTEYSNSYVFANGEEYGGLVAEGQGEIFSGAFNFIFESEDVSTLPDFAIAELKSHIVEHPAVILTKGSWYHFNGSLENQVGGIQISKVANLDTGSPDTWMESMGQDWSIGDGCLFMGNHKYGYSPYTDYFEGSFDFVYDGTTDLELTGNYAYYSEKITVSPLQTVDHNTYAGGAGTEAFGHTARSTGILTKAYGDGAVSEGGNTQAGVLVDLNVYSRDYDATGDTYQTYLIPSVKYTHAGGLGTKATAEAQTVFGKYNKENPNALFIVGNGTADNIRNNAMEVLADGRVKVKSAPVDSDDVVRKGDLGESGGGLHTHDICLFIGETSSNAATYYFRVICNETDAFTISALDSYFDAYLLTTTYRGYGPDEGTEEHGICGLNDNGEWFFGNNTYSRRTGYKEIDYDSIDGQ